MEPLVYTPRIYTEGAPLPAEEIRADLRTRGVCVVTLYAEDDPRAAAYEAGLDAAAASLRPDGGTAHGARGMGGITKTYGAGCHPGSARVRTDPRARAVRAAIYGLEPNDVFASWDAVAVLGTDAIRKKPARRALAHEYDEKAYFALTGGTLQAHVDVGAASPGAAMEARMRAVHPDFAACVQSQFVCKTVPRGGATLVVSPGPHYAAPPAPGLFEAAAGRDFCPATPAGYRAYAGTWRAVEVPRGSLVLWLSRTPHGNKLADVGVDPERRAVYIAWQARALVGDYEGEDALRALKRRKLDAVYAGGTTDHWATHVPKVHRGSHYSNGKGVTQVLPPPEYDAALAAAIDAAF